MTIVTMNLKQLEILSVCKIVLLLIAVLVDQVDLFRANEKNYEEVVENKDKIIDLKDEEIKKLKSTIRGATAAIILTTISFVLVLL